MAKKIRMEFISDGFKTILRCDKMMQLVGEVGNDIASRATAAIPYDGSAGYRFHYAFLGYGQGRIGGYVVPAFDSKGNVDYLAMLAESTDKVLTKAVQS